MHDPRGMRPMLGELPVNPTGGDHTGAGQHRTSLRNTIGLCQFLAYDEPLVTSSFAAATGWDVTDEELRAVVSRGLSLARLFNLREGMTALTIGCRSACTSQSSKVRSRTRGSPGKK